MVRESTYKILLVDDDLDCLDAVDQILRREGYETFANGDGQSAVETIITNRVDLAIIDFDLPDTDGFHLLYELKRISRNLPVIIMTARASKETRLAALEAGAFSFIPKPINIPNFRQIVARALSTPRTRTVTVRRQMVVTRWIRWIKHK
jgi:DNA-binding response OmpR family regulator